MAGPQMEPKVRDFLTQLRQDAFLEIKEGYVDSGAAPGKDTRWQDVAELKPQTTTKDEVAARQSKKLLGVDSRTAGSARPNREPTPRDRRGARGPGGVRPARRRRKPPAPRSPGQK